MGTIDRRGYHAGARPRIMAHRGSSGISPENTMEAFQQAVRDGADILEMDVRMSRDGEIVVIHDESLDRTTNGSGPVLRLPYDCLREFDAGYRFSADGGRTFPFRGKGIVVPRFADVLEAFPQMPINVEIKDNSRLIAQKMSELLRRFGRSDNGSVLVAAEPACLMNTVRQLSDKVPTGHCRSEVIRFLASTWLRVPLLCKRALAPALQIPYKKFGFKIAGPTVFENAHRLGLQVHVWTVNDPSEMSELINLGVDGIFTDFPARMKALL